jgi:hemerythrin-like domain-containing protein
MFAALLDAEPGLADVVARLKAVHGVIAAVLARFDQALVRVLREDAEAMSEVAATAEELSQLLLSHLAYEEGQLDYGLARLELQF